MNLCDENTPLPTYWQPTMHLRWRALAKHADCPYVLEQFFQCNEREKSEWRQVPYVYEEQKS